MGLASPEFNHIILGDTSNLPTANRKVPVFGGSKFEGWGVACFKTLGDTSISILSRDPNLFRKASKTQGKQIRFLERTIVGKNGNGINP